MEEEQMMETAPDEALVCAKKKRRLSLPKTKKGRKRLRNLVILVVVAALAGSWFLRRPATNLTSGSYTAALAEKKDLTVTVTGTGTLQPADSYQVTTLLTGAILSAPFEEGDMVSKDSLLYTMDSGNAQENLSRAGISVAQAQLSYQQAQEALAPTATISGVLNEVYVHDGANVTPGTALAKIVASTDLSVDFLFTYVSPDQFYIGQSATVFIGDLTGSVQGTVTAVSDATSVTSNGKQSCTVRVKVANPGIVSDAFTASAAIGSYISYGSSPLNMAAASVVYATGSGAVSGFSKLSGSTVTKGEKLCTLDSESNRTQLKAAKLGLETAQLSANTAQEALGDYAIKSPISGTVIEKKLKAGDKVDGVSSGTLAVIYDLSCLKVEMSVNELDIGKVQVGQSVKITAAALPGESFTGMVEKVSINGTTTNGFTTYPVTIAIQDFGELKPGMNVSATILGETAQGAICIPVDAVSRGNTVLVPGEGAMAPDGVTVADAAKLEERAVTLGRNDDQFIEILSGLEEGDTVLLQTQAATGMGG